MKNFLNNTQQVKDSGCNNNSSLYVKQQYTEKQKYGNNPILAQQLPDIEEQEINDKSTVQNNNQSVMNTTRQLINMEDSRNSFQNNPNLVQQQLQTQQQKERKSIYSQRQSIQMQEGQLFTTFPEQTNTNFYENVSFSEAYKCQKQQFQEYTSQDQKEHEIQMQQQQQNINIQINQTNQEDSVSLQKITSESQIDNNSSIFEPEESVHYKENLNIFKRNIFPAVILESQLQEINNVVNSNNSQKQLKVNMPGKKKIDSVSYFRKKIEQPINHVKFNSETDKTKEKEQLQFTKRFGFINNIPTKFENSFQHEKQDNEKNQNRKIMTFVNFITILVNILRFSKISRHIVSERKKRDQLTIFQLNIINDKSHNRKISDLEKFNDFQALKNYSICQKIEKKITTFILRYISCVPIILPNSKWKILWDCWVNSFIIYRMFVVTIKLVFFFNNIEECIDMIDIRVVALINISYIFDVILNFNTGSYQKGIMVTERHLIVLNYLKGDFLKNSLAQIPQIMQYYTDQDSSKTQIQIQYLLEILIFLQWFSLTNVFNRIERILTENESIAATFPLIRLVVNIIFIAHIVGLMWCLCAFLEMHFTDEQNTWISMEIKGYHMYKTHWSNVYIQSYYWAVSTMVTILLYIPSTNIEIIFSIFAIFICGGCFGYALNIIGQILNDMNKKNIQFKSEREMVNRMLKQNNITQELKERVQLYIDYLQEQEKNKNLEEEQIVLNRLSAHLKNEIQCEIFRKIIKKFDIIYNNFSEKTVNSTMLKISKQLYSPEAQIFSEDDHLDLYLYIIEKGEIQISYQNQVNIQNQRGNINDTLIQENNAQNKLLQDVQLANGKNNNNNINHNNNHLEEHQETVIQKFNKQGQMFGLIEFFTGQRRITTCKATSSSTIYKIARDDFLEIVSKDPEEYEKFCMIQHTMLQRNFLNKENRSTILQKQQSLKEQETTESFKKLQLQHSKQKNISTNSNNSNDGNYYFYDTNLVLCQVCKQNFHLEKHCNLVQYYPSYQTISQNKVGVQIRVQYYRKPDKYRCLQNLGEIQENVQEIFEGKNKLSELALEFREYLEDLQYNSEDDDNDDDDYNEYDEEYDNQNQDSQDDSDSSDDQKSEENSDDNMIDKMVQLNYKGRGSFIPEEGDLQIQQQIKEFNNKQQNNNNKQKYQQLHVQKQNSGIIRSKQKSMGGPAERVRNKQNSQVAIRNKQISLASRNQTYFYNNNQNIDKSPSSNSHKKIRNFSSKTPKNQKSNTGTIKLNIKPAKTLTNFDDQNMNNSQKQKQQQQQQVMPILMLNKKGSFPIQQNNKFNLEVTPKNKKQVQYSIQPIIESQSSKIEHSKTNNKNQQQKQSSSSNSSLEEIDIEHEALPVLKVTKSSSEKLDKQVQNNIDNNKNTQIHINLCQNQDQQQQDSKMQDSQQQKQEESKNEQHQNTILLTPVNNSYENNKSQSPSKKTVLNSNGYKLMSESKNHLKIQNPQNFTSQIQQMKMGASYQPKNPLSRAKQISMISSINNSNNNNEMSFLQNSKLLSSYNSVLSSQFQKNNKNLTKINKSNIKNYKKKTSNHNLDYIENKISQNQLNFSRKKGNLDPIQQQQMLQLLQQQLSIQQFDSSGGQNKNNNNNYNINNNNVNDNGNNNNTLMQRFTYMGAHNEYEFHNEKREWDLQNIDFIKEYKYFYPHNNYTVVVSNYKPIKEIKKKVTKKTQRILSKANIMKIQKKNINSEKALQMIFTSSFKKNE